jgi:ribonuclease HII
MKLICGVDEAGRGPLSGSVFAAAVILPQGHGIVGLNDSKKLSAARREKLFIEIQANALAWSIASASVEEIDSINILQATMLAMQRAIAGLSVTPHEALIDGNRTPTLTIPARAIVQGDALEPSISAASILAKVSRDREAREMDARYPQYGFAKHKGYGTPQHLAALRQFGPTPEHRCSFAPVREAGAQTTLW